ncbi:MAG TPA: helicase C-terminal domain-containing protein [Sedimentisphaerales bacterium]|nr:helicase C-terminal domain-containing protein [Sedimentisphaerales bacterium]
MAKSDLSVNVQEMLGAGGPVSQSMRRFEVRPQQVQMAGAVQRALASGRNLAVEAGTGVGKTFAYLIPAIDAVNRTKAKALISTYTITLQEQLCNKDIPFLHDCMPQGFTAALAKGRGNYLCRRRLDFFVRAETRLFADSDSELRAISAWARTTEDGSLSDIPFAPKSHTWDRVKSEHGNCRGRKCPFFRDCFYRRDRRRLDNADIIVANHALLFSDLSLREQGASVLPDYRYVVIDEAHNVEHVAEDHFGIDISSGRVRFLLDRLYNPRTRRGLLAYTDARDAMGLVSRVNSQSKLFFEHVQNWYEQNKDETNGRCHMNFVDDPVSGSLGSLKVQLLSLAKETDDADEKLEMMRFADQCQSLIEDFDAFLMQKKAGHVYWVEADAEQQARIRLRSAPVNVADDVRRCLFEKYDSVILTSATLSTANGGASEGFEFFAGRIGLEDFDALKLGSPFDYQRQVTLYIEKDLPNPNDPAFVEAAAEAAKKYLLKTAGRAFLLFTSYAMLDQMAEKLTPWLESNGIEVLQQAAQWDRTTLLKYFRAEGKRVLFGTDSFWQGVDVPGKALSNVIIVRLPFAVPDQPLLAGRMEQITEQGGNPFYDYQLPSAIIKFKQGFGRLIRSKNDTGIVVVLDSRIITKSYGATFLAAVPKCSTEIVAAQENKSADRTGR